MGIQITEKDVGRRVLLRNRTVCTITDYYRGGKWPVRLDNGEWVMNSGFFTNTNSPGELDVVLFLGEEPQTTGRGSIGQFLASTVSRELHDLGYDSGFCQLVFDKLTDALNSENQVVLEDVLTAHFRPTKQASREGEQD